MFSANPLGCLQVAMQNIQRNAVFMKGPSLYKQLFYHNVNIIPNTGVVKY